MSNNSLKINEDKTEFIIFNTIGNSENKYTIEIKNNVIHMSEHVKFLGVYLDTAMTLEKQISTTCRRAYMRRINSIRQYLPESAAKTIIQMMVVSRLDYCNSLYNGLPMKSIKNLEATISSELRGTRITNRTLRRHMTPCSKKFTLATNSETLLI